MLRTLAERTLRWAALVMLAVAFAAAMRPTLAADAPAGQVLAKKSQGFRGRLPPHYAKVVTEEQRAKIYKIQEEYWPRIEELESQLKALKTECAEKIAAVLTQEQKKKVEEAAAKVQQRPAKPPQTAPAVRPAGTMPAK